MLRAKAVQSSGCSFSEVAELMTEVGSWGSTLLRRLNIVFSMSLNDTREATSARAEELTSSNTFLNVSHDTSSGAGQYRFRSIQDDHHVHLPLETNHRFSLFSPTLYIVCSSIRSTAREYLFWTLGGTRISNYCVNTVLDFCGCLRVFCAF